MPAKKPRAGSVDYWQDVAREIATERNALLKAAVAVIAAKESGSFGVDGAQGFKLLRAAVEQIQADCGECTRGWIHSDDPYEIQRCDSCATLQDDIHAHQRHAEECGCEAYGYDCASCGSTCRPVKDDPNCRWHCEHCDREYR